MPSVTYTDLRRNLARVMDEAVSSRAPILVTLRGGKGNVVILSEEEFEGWTETVHLLCSPANAEHLLRSLRAAEDGRTQERDVLAPHPSMAGPGTS
jgi:antitoxin YefM